MTPLQCYESDLKSGKLLPDPAQRHAVLSLQRLYDDLFTEAAPRTSWLGRLSSGFSRPRPKRLMGVYLWGGVGVGKTYLMDRFFECLPSDQKKRVHFHRFMQSVHHHLKSARGKSNPIRQVANRLTQQTRILCLDELYVSDIGDAMILARLLEVMFENAVILITTSNRPPDDLYKDGLQRVRFLPAIKLLKKHTKIIELCGSRDYRLKYLEKANIYHIPHDKYATKVLLDEFQQLASNEGSQNEPYEVNGRPIGTLRLADGVVWFEFDDICSGPRSQLDYIEIARCFNSVLISNIPVMGLDNDIAKRFITLVDEFYDRNVKLIVSAEAPPDSLYEGKKLNFEFQRTTSRLVEMQSHEYLARQHLG
ncbi:MAG: cell division protein ZapE [Gammaproteobacteria bacterium]|nr:cell division protein ZapE [Gammaproteobacteria bacterium]